MQSILVTVFCCLPLGIAGIINSSQASSKQAAGDYDGAVKSAQRAKLFCWIAVGAGLVGAAIYAVVAAANGGTDF